MFFLRYVTCHSELLTGPTSCKCAVTFMWVACGAFGTQCIVDGVWRTVDGGGWWVVHDVRCGGRSVHCVGSRPLRFVQYNGNSPSKEIQSLLPRDTFQKYCDARTEQQSRQDPKRFGDTLLPWQFLHRARLHAGPLRLSHSLSLSLSLSLSVSLSLSLRGT